MNVAVVNSIEPLVTVALPVFNGGDLLALSVRSVLDQSWKNWELIILDDGSSDGAVERLKSIGDPRITVVCDELNLGLSARLNQAVSLARGKYFARMDHDDICHPERLAKQVAFLESNSGVDLLATRCITIDEHERINGCLPFSVLHSTICRHPWRGFYMAHPTWMGRIEWFRKNLYQDPPPYCCEDQELLLRAHRFSRYHTLPECLLAYRVRSHTPFRKLWKTRIAMMRMRVKHFFSIQQWINLFLSFVVDLLRVVYDCWAELRYKLCLPIKIRFGVPPSDFELQDWGVVIDNLKSTNPVVEKSLSHKR